MSARVDPGFWRDRRVLLTGHTGFKGAWTALWLTDMGAKVTGLALPPETAPSLYEMCGVADRVGVAIGDIRQRETVAAAIAISRPEIVIHMAAQSLVRRAMREPVETFDINVMGTATLLDALRGAADLRAILVVTTDKVYAATAHARPFREGDPLGGLDPYSASKAAVEILT